MSDRPPRTIRDRAIEAAASLVVGLFAYLGGLFLVCALVEPGWRPFDAATVPTHVVLGPLICGAAIALLARLRRSIPNRGAAVIETRSSATDPSRVEFRVSFWSSDAPYVETAERSRYEETLRALRRMAELGHGVHRVEIDNRVTPERRPETPHAPELAEPRPNSPTPPSAPAREHEHEHEHEHADARLEAVV